MIFASIDVLIGFICHVTPPLVLITAYFLNKVSFSWVIGGQMLLFVVVKLIIWANDSLNRLVYKRFNVSDPLKYDTLSHLIAEKKVFCIVTGGSNGLGAAISRALLTKYGHFRNFTLVIIDRKKAENSTINEHKRSLFVEFDLAGEARDLARKLPAEITKGTGCYTVLINNCGTRHTFDSFMSVWSEECFNRIFRVNVLAAANLMHILNPDYLVTISSILSLVTPKNASIYSASKAALSALHQSFAQMSNKRALLVLPGQLKDTALFAEITNERTFLAPPVDVDELAGRIVANMEKLQNGTTVAPLYGYFIQILDRLPYWLAALLRSYSGIDKASDIK